VKTVSYVAARAPSALQLSQLQQLICCFGGNAIAVS
jgi:hypothetical protein